MTKVYAIRWDKKDQLSIYFWKEGERVRCRSFEGHDFMWHDYWIEDELSKEIEIVEIDPKKLGIDECWFSYLYFGEAHKLIKKLMKEYVKIKEGVGDMEEFERLLKEVKEIIKKAEEEERKKEEEEKEKVRKMLEEGIPEEVVISKIKNQYGEWVKDDYIYIDRNELKCYHARLLCYSAESEGLGTCRCVTHNTWEVMEIGPEEYLEIVKEHYNK